MERRDIEVSDVTAIIKLMLIMQEESPLGVHLHIERTNYILSTILGYDDVFAQGYFDEDGLCWAILIGNLDENMFFNAVSAAELVTYVHPQKRGTMMGPTLIKQFSKWAEEKDVNWVKIEVSSGINSERTKQLYSKLGYNTDSFLAMKGVH